MVGLKVDNLWYEIGSADFFNSWFSTINYHLEKRKWGKKYPVLMNELYQGLVKYDNLKTLKNEILKVQKKLKKYKPNQVIWDIRNLDSKPPWGNNIRSEISDLSNYFVSSNGEDLFEVLIGAIDKAIEYHTDLMIDNL